MKVTIDISQIIHKGTGVARFTRGLTEAILSHGHGPDWTFFYASLRRKLDRPLVSAIAAHHARLVSVPIPPTLLTILWNDIHLVKTDRFVGKQDWFISSDWTEPPSGSRKATIVHDVIFKKYPETVAASIRRVQTKRLNRVKAESELIIADSEATRDDLVDLIGIEKSRIKVIYPGVTITKPTIEQITRTQFKFGLHGPFILAVGKVEPRKNLTRLIEAYRNLKNPGTKLVIAGPPGWDSIDMSPSDDVVFLGYVSDQELYSLYASAVLYMFPSLYEGFGYPAIEAMALGCPVALSNTSSLKELGSGYAHLFDPTDTKAMTAIMYEMITNTKYRTTYIEKAKEYSRSFTWKHYYQTLMKTLTTL